jgi:hypothetical protein
LSSKVVWCSTTECGAIFEHLNSNQKEKLQKILTTLALPLGSEMITRSGLNKLFKTK